MKRKKLYFYDAFSRQSSIRESHLIITCSIKKFPHTEGCVADEFGTNLLRGAVGKKFILEGLDPIQFGIVTYLGTGKKVFPFGDDIYEKIDGSNFLTFKKMGKNGATLSIQRYRAKIKPIGKQIGDVIVGEKVGIDIDAKIPIYKIRRDSFNDESDIKRTGFIRFYSDKSWVSSRKIDNLEKILKFVKQKYPNG